MSAVPNGRALAAIDVSSGFVTAHEQGSNVVGVNASTVQSGLISDPQFTPQKNYLPVSTGPPQVQYSFERVSPSVPNLEELQSEAHHYAFRDARYTADDERRATFDVLPDDPLTDLMTTTPFLIESDLDFARAPCGPSEPQRNGASSPVTYDQNQLDPLERETTDQESGALICSTRPEPQRTQFVEEVQVPFSISDSLVSCGPADRVPIYSVPSLEEATVPQVAFIDDTKSQTQPPKPQQVIFPSTPSEWHAQSGIQDGSLGEAAVTHHSEGIVSLPLLPQGLGLKVTLGSQRALDQMPQAKHTARQTGVSLAARQDTTIPANYQTDRAFPSKAPTAQVERERAQKKKANKSTAVTKRERGLPKKASASKRNPAAPVSLRPMAMPAQGGLHVKPQARQFGVGPIPPPASSPLSASARGAQAPKQAHRIIPTNLTASKYCHVCTRSANAVEMAYCRNIGRGTCRKIICSKCAVEFRWPDVTEAIRKKSVAALWECVHCRRVCPPKAQCNTYGRINFQRRERGKRKREEKAAAAAGAAAAAAAGGAAEKVKRQRKGQASSASVQIGRERTDRGSAEGPAVKKGPGKGPSQPQLATTANQSAAVRAHAQKVASAAAAPQASVLAQDAKVVDELLDSSLAEPKFAVDDPHETPSLQEFTLLLNTIVAQGDVGDVIADFSFAGLESFDL